MGLVLTLREGDDFYVDDVRIVVEEVMAEGHFVLYDPENDTRWEVTDTRSVEVLKDVLICAATSAPVAVNIEAPRSVKLVRGSLKRGDKR